MFGRTDLITTPIIIIAAIAAATDLMYGKIYNWLTLPALLLGLIMGFVSGSWSGEGGALLGAALGLLLYGWMFWIGVMGGGDVKLLMALGAWGGPRFVVEVAIFGIIVGGAIAAVMLLMRGRLGDFSKRIKGFLMSLLIKELEFVPPKIDHGLKMPYGVPIAIAAILVAGGQVHLW